MRRSGYFFHIGAQIQSAIGVPGMLGLDTGADMAADHHVVVRASLPHRIPMVGVDRREPMQPGVVREQDRVIPQLGHAADFLGRQFAVPPRNPAQRNAPPRRCIAPIVQVLVVVGLDGGERNLPRLLVLLGALLREAGQGRKADGSQHTVGVHVVRQTRRGSPAADFMARGFSPK